MIEFQAGLRAREHERFRPLPPLLRHRNELDRMKLTLARAKELLAATTGDPHLVVHATNVRGCMEAFARHFGQPIPCIDGMKPYAAETGLLPKA